jgi:hypothetical protein
VYLSREHSGFTDKITVEKEGKYGVSNDVCMYMNRRCEEEVETLKSHRKGEQKMDKTGKQKTQIQARIMIVVCHVQSVP